MMGAGWDNFSDNRTLWLTLHNENVGSAIHGGASEERLNKRNKGFGRIKKMAQQRSIPGRVKVGLRVGERAKDNVKD